MNERSPYSNPENYNTFDAELRSIATASDTKELIKKMPELFSAAKKIFNTFDAATSDEQLSDEIKKITRYEDQQLLIVRALNTLREKAGMKTVKFE